MPVNPNLKPNNTKIILDNGAGKVKTNTQTAQEKAIAQAKANAAAAQAAAQAGKTGTNQDKLKPTPVATTTVTGSSGSQKTGSGASFSTTPKSSTGSASTGKNQTFSPSPNYTMVDFTSGMTSDPVTGKIKYYPENHTTTTTPAPKSNPTPASTPAPTPTPTVTSEPSSGGTNVVYVGGGGGGGGYSNNGGERYEPMTVEPSYTTYSHYEPRVAEFKPSEEYEQAMAYANELLKKLSDGRTSYTDKVNSQLDKIAGKDPFAYDFNTDPLFQSQLASSMRSGQKAMQDTIGQNAALNGGYGSSYGTKAANQAYNEHVQAAYDNLPAYYQIAEDSYYKALNEDYRLLDALNDMDIKEFNRAGTIYDLNYMNAANQYNREYAAYWKKEEFNEASRQFGATFDEQSRQWATEFNENSRQWANEFNKQDRQFAADFNEKVREYNVDDQFRRERASVGDYQWGQEFAYNQYRDSVLDRYRSSGGGSSRSYSGGSSSSSSKSTGSTGSTVKTSGWKAMTSTVEKQIANAMKQYGDSDQFWDYMAELMSTYGENAVTAVIDRYANTNSLGSDGKLYDGWNNKVQTNRAGAAQGMGGLMNDQFVTFTQVSGSSLENGKFICNETGDTKTTYTYAQLKNWFGDNILNHITK